MTAQTAEPNRFSASIPNPDQTLYSIQALRAFAAWAIVLHHYFLIFGIEWSRSTFRELFLLQGSAGVDVFFVVSGFVMAITTNKYSTPWEFLARRAARIVPAYWVVTLLVAAMIVCFPQVMLRQGFSFPFLVKSLLFIPAQNPSGLGLFPINTVGWTLNLEVVFYIIIGASLFITKSGPWVFVALALFVLQNQLHSLGLVSDFYVRPVIFEFLLGVVAGHLWRSGLVKGPTFAYALLALIALMSLLRNTEVDRLINWGFPSFFLVLGFLGMEPIFRKARYLKILGDHSYSVYLTHATIFFVGWHLHERYALDLLVTSAVCFAAVAGLAALSFNWIERPIGSWLAKKLLGNVRAPSGEA